MKTFDFRYEKAGRNRFEIFVHETEFLCAVESETQAEREIMSLVNVCCDDADKISIVNGRTVRM